MRKTLLLLSVALMGHYSVVIAQSTCAQTLRLAQSVYEQGRLQELPGLLENCLKSGFTDAEKTNAYKLLTLTYIYLEEPEKADEAMLTLLRTNHEFHVNDAVDPAEFVALHKTFRTEPIYRIGLKLGANASQPNVVSFVPANDGASAYNDGMSFQAALFAEVPLTPKLTLNPEINFILKNFSYENTASYTDLSSGESRSFKTTATENQTWVTLPIVVQYKVATRKFNPYVSAGVSADYLLGAENTYLRTKEKATSLDEQSIELTEYRNAMNVSAILAAGVKFKVTAGFMLIEMRYSYGLTKVNNKEDIYNLYEKTFTTGGYTDGVFKMNSLSLTVGYAYNIFKPIKLKH